MLMMIALNLYFFPEQTLFFFSTKLQMLSKKYDLILFIIATLESFIAAAPYAK